METPLGSFSTYLKYENRSTKGVLPDEAFQLSSGAILSRFLGDHFVAEVLVGPINPQIPQTRQIEGCLAAIWRVRAIAEIQNCRFACSWPATLTDANGGPSSGEGLDALTWQDTNYALSLGTEDGEFLAARAAREDNVPIRLIEELSLSTVEYHPMEIVVPFSGLQPPEQIQIQFIIAWEQGGDSTSTWFAVEQDPAILLDQLLRPPLDPSQQ